MTNFPVVLQVHCKATLKSVPDTFEPHGPSSSKIPDNRESKKPHAFAQGFLPGLMPGSVLLSHGETPHYHRRYGVSLLSSAWGQVGPPRYCRQANLFHSNRYSRSHRNQSRNFTENLLVSLKHLRCCKVKPHGSLVLVSSMHRCTYTPSLSTSSS